MNTLQYSTLHVHTVDNQPVLVLTPDIAAFDLPQRAPAEGQCYLIYPHWYRANAQSVLQVVGKTSIRPGKLASTSVEDWRLDLETLLEMPLETRMQALSTIIRFTVFFHPPTVLSQYAGATCFPPLSYIHTGLHLYQTDTQGRLQVLGPFSTWTLPTREAYLQRFRELTGLAASTTITGRDGEASPSPVVP